MSLEVDCKCNRATNVHNFAKKPEGETFVKKGLYISQAVKIVLSVYLAASGNQLSARTIGSIVDDSIYTESSAEKTYYGLLNLLVFIESKYNDRWIVSGGNCDIWINDKKIASIEQSFFNISRQRGDFNFLSLPLPNGKYTVSIYSRPTLSEAKKHTDFEVVVRKGKTLSILVDTLDKSDRGIKVSPKGLPKTFGTFTLESKNNKIFEDYDLILQNAAEQAINFASIESQAKNEIEENKQRQIAVDLKNKEERERTAQEMVVLEKEKAAALQLEQEKKIKAAEETVAKEDDGKCKSFGAKLGTQAYILCRATMTANRAEAIERKQAAIALEKKLENIQKQILEQERARTNDQARVQQEQRESNVAIQQALAAEHERIEKAERAKESQRWFELAAKFSQPQQMNKTQSSVSPIQTYTINGRTITCNTIGNITNCN